MHLTSRLTFLAVVVASLLAVPVVAQEDSDAADLGFFDSAELSLVRNSGNSESETFGFKNTALYRGEKGSFELEVGGLRAESSITRRRAVESSNGGFTLTEAKERGLSAEHYFLRGRYDREISERLFWFVGAGWERNRFAGYRGRTSGTAGVGHLWWERDGGHLRTTYGVTYTREDTVVPRESGADTFAGLRFGWDYRRRLTGTTTFGSVLVTDANLDDTRDYRADIVNWIGVKMSERLALRVSFQMLYDNQPGLVELPLEGPDGSLTGRNVRVPLEELDTVLSTTLVVDF